MALSKGFDKIFLNHPRSVGESYIQHMGAAFRFGVLLFVAGLAACIHAIFPCLFETAASDIIKKINDEIKNRKTP